MNETLLIRNQEYSHEEFSILIGFFTASAAVADTLRQQVECDQITFDSAQIPVRSFRLEPLWYGHSHIVERNINGDRTDVILRDVVGCGTEPTDSFPFRCQDWHNTVRAELIKTTNPASPYVLQVTETATGRSLRTIVAHRCTVRTTSVER
jgi:hypothetical protein